MSTRLILSVGVNVPEDLVRQEGSYVETQRVRRAYAKSLLGGLETWYSRGDGHREEVGGYLVREVDMAYHYVEMDSLAQLGAILAVNPDGMIIVPWSIDQAHYVVSSVYAD